MARVRRRGASSDPLDGRVSFKDDGLAGPTLLLNGRAKKDSHGRKRCKRPRPAPAAVSPGATQIRSGTGKAALPRQHDEQRSRGGARYSPAHAQVLLDPLLRLACPGDSIAGKLGRQTRLSRRPGLGGGFSICPPRAPSDHNAPGWQSFLPFRHWILALHGGQLNAP